MTRWHRLFAVLQASSIGRLARSCTEPQAPARPREQGSREARMATFDTENSCGRGYIPAVRREASGDRRPDRVAGPNQGRHHHFMPAEPLC